MSNLSYRAMAATFAVVDLVRPRAAQRAAGFGVEPGMTVVDYGCGPGRHTVPLARLVGQRGRVYAVDIQKLAVAAVGRKAAKLDLENVVPVVAIGYDSTLPSAVADMVFALDMFFNIAEPDRFLREVQRILKPEGVLVIDPGHEPRSETKRKIAAAGLFELVAEAQDHLKYRSR
jgi:ubiquinone/menaquinone biosynthesis C-methylase UbiE